MGVGAVLAWQTVVLVMGTFVDISTNAASHEHVAAGAGAFVAAGGIGAGVGARFVGLIAFIDIHAF